MAQSISAPRIRSAEQASIAFLAALNDGRLDDAARCFTRDACLLTADSTAVRGRESIRAVLGQLIAMGVETAIDQRGLVIAGDVAIAIATWTSHFTSQEPGFYTRSATSTAVLRRVEGTWKLHIAAPWSRSTN